MSAESANREPERHFIDRVVELLFGRRSHIAAKDNASADGASSYETASGGAANPEPISGEPMHGGPATEGTTPERSRAETFAALRDNQDVRATPRYESPFSPSSGQCQMPASARDKVLSRAGVEPTSVEAQRAGAAIADEVGDVLRHEVGAEQCATTNENFAVHFHPTHRRIRAVRGPKRAVDKGQAITRFERLATDGRVFDRRRAGGSVVIDQSGSMALSYEDVAEAIERFPALTIGRYSGSYNGGVLCVLADHGLLGDLGTCKAGGSNSVDIEALAWLSKQPEPRVWVSDGIVHGGLIAVLGSEEAREVIISLCQRNRIVRVDTFDQAIAVLQRGIARGIAIEPRDADFLHL